MRPLRPLNNFLMLGWRLNSLIYQIYKVYFKRTDSLIVGFVFVILFLHLLKMIHSTTELINEILDEIDQVKFDDPVFETSLKKSEYLYVFSSCYLDPTWWKEEKTNFCFTESIVKKYTKEYATRFCSIQGIFLRSSWMSKLHYLTRFINEITGVLPLVVLLTTFYNTSGKLAHYSAAE